MLISIFAWIRVNQSNKLNIMFMVCWFEDIPSNTMEIIHFSNLFHFAPWVPTVVQLMVLLIVVHLL